MTSEVESGLAEPLTLPRSSWDEISLLDLVTPVVRAWKRILIFMFVAGAFAAAALFCSPQIPGRAPPWCRSPPTA